MGKNEKYLKTALMAGLIVAICLFSLCLPGNSRAETRGLLEEYSTVSVSPTFGLATDSILIYDPSLEVSNNRVRLGLLSIET